MRYATKYSLFFFFIPQHSELDKTPPTPASLYKMAALLLHRGLVKLEDFYSHVSCDEYASQYTSQTSPRVASLPGLHCRAPSLV